MSLADPFVVLDAVLQTVMQQDVYLAVRSDAPPGGGSGTWDDPYYGAQPNPSNSPSIDASNADLFDAIMSDAAKVPAGCTVYLGPGTFCTKGNPGDGTGWSVRDGLRLLGASTSGTTLKLVGVPNGQTRYAIGMNFSGPGLRGCEIREITVDCNFNSSAGSGTTASAIRLHGAHVLIERIAIKNWGSVGGSVFNVLTAAADYSEHCTIKDCRIGPAGAGHSGSANCYAFDTTTATHRFCTVRNCSAVGIISSSIPPITGDIRGIAPGAGLGAVIDGNQVENCAFGVYSDKTASDVIVWNNKFRNVLGGIKWQNNTSSPVGRLILTDNDIELATVAGSSWVGIQLATTAGAARFQQALVRRNVIRDVQSGATITNGLTGIDVGRCSSLQIDNNIINNTKSDFGVRFSNCGLVRVLNNQTTAGGRLSSYDATTNMPLVELVDVLLNGLVPLMGPQLPSARNS